MVCSGVDKQRGTVFEIQAGRVDVGASIQVNRVLCGQINTISEIEISRSLYWKIQLIELHRMLARQFLSQYPGEEEFLMQPLSCLEVMRTSSGRYSLAYALMNA